MTAQARWSVAAGASALVAALVAVWSGLTMHATYEPATDAVLGPGDSVIVEGLRITLDRFETVRTVPSPTEDAAPWVAPAGAVAVVVRYTVALVDPAAKGTDKVCGVSLQNGDDTWGGAGLRVGEVVDAATSCVPDEKWWQQGRRREVPVALAFVLPEDAVAGSEARLDFWYDERTIIALRAAPVPTQLPSATPSTSR